MDNKLSKPVAYMTAEGVAITRLDFESGSWGMHNAAKSDDMWCPLYSQEYVSALLSSIDGMSQTINVANDATRIWKERALAAEAKLATPVRLTDERTLWVGEDDYDTGHVKGWNANRIEQAALLKKQGFTVEGDDA